MDPLIWAAILLALGIALAVIELFVPSGGLLGLLALVALAGGIGLAFHRGPWTGLTFLAILARETAAKDSAPVLEIASASERFATVLRWTGLDAVYRRAEGGNTA